MTTSIVLGAIVAAAAVATATVRADERMRAGNYELTTTVTVAGKSSTPPVTNRCADESAVRPVNGDALSLRTTAELAARTARLGMKDYSLRGNTQAYTLVGPGLSITTATALHLRPRLGRHGRRQDVEGSLAENGAGDLPAHRRLPVGA